MSQPPIEEEPVEVPGWADAPVTGDRVDVSTNPIVVGDPDGARVEVAGDGLHAYDSTGTETARIQGEGGEFVGGEFRTSDSQPGQVTLSDTALQNPYSGISEPGIRVEPINSSGYARLPGVGPSDDNMLISGGQGPNGNLTNVILSPISAAMQWRHGDAWAFTSTSQDAVYSQARAANGDHGEIQAAPTNTILRTTQADGRGGAMQTTPDGATVTQSDSSGLVSSVHVDEDEAYLFTRAGGASRYLSVDDSGVWVKTNRGGTWKQHNLEETAQDSGWQPFSALSGISTSGDLAWRNKGGIIYLRGYVTGSWTQGYQFLTDQLPPEIRPSALTASMAVSSQDNSMMLRIHTTGRIDLNKPVAGSATVYLNGLSWPIG